MLQRKEFESWRLNHPKKESAADWTATGWALLGVVGLAGIFFGVSMLPFVSEVRDVEAAVFAPTAAIEHEKFEIVVQVENTAAHPQTVQEVGIERSFLTGVTILETDPPFTKTHRNVFPAAEVYELNQNVPANSKATILLRAQATRPGEHGGTLAVCMNYTTNCLFYDLKLKVAPKE